MKIHKSPNAAKRILDTYDELLKAWDVPFEEMNIDTSYGSTHIIACGDTSNPPLVLFHGVGDTSALMWVYNAKALSEKFRLYAIDTIGGPGKSIPNGNYGVSFDCVKWLDEVLIALDLEKIYVAGVSMGGYIAQLYTLNRHNKVIKALCMASTVMADDSNTNFAMLRVFLPEALFPTKKNVIKLMKKLTGKNIEMLIDNALILEHYLYLLQGFNNMAMRFHKIKKFNTDEINKMRDKLYFLVGESDPFALYGGKEALIKHKMNVRFYPDVGHGINHEIPDMINNEIIDYFHSVNSVV